MLLEYDTTDAQPPKSADIWPQLTCTSANLRSKFIRFLPGMVEVVGAVLVCGAILIMCVSNLRNRRD